MVGIQGDGDGGQFSCILFNERSKSFTVCIGARDEERASCVCKVVLGVDNEKMIIPGHDFRSFRKLINIEKERSTKKKGMSRKK